MIVACIGALVFGSFVSALPTARAASRTFVIEMSNTQFHPALLQADPGDVVTVRVFNNDTVGHTFDIAEFAVHIGNRTSPLQPGQNDSRTFTADREGTFWFFCDILGHASRAGAGYAGMAGRLIIGQTGTSSLDPTLYIIVGIAVTAAIVFVALYVLRRKK
jgi:plastocyanin